MALTDQNVVYYKMEEGTGATRVDSISGLNLTDHNSVAQVAGKNNFGAGFTAASTQYLSHIHNAKFSADPTNNGLTIGFWYYPTLATAQGIMSKGFLNGGSQLEWQFIQQLPAGAMEFYVSYNGSSVAAVIGAVPTLNAWNYILGWWDRDAASIYIAVNCAVSGPIPLSPNTPFVGTGDFNIGRIFNNFAEYGTYRVDEVSIWQRILSSSERALLCGGTYYPYGGQVAWELYLERAQNNAVLSAGAYGIPTYFIFPQQTSGVQYVQENNVIDTNGVLPGDPAYLKVRRFGGDSNNTDVTNQTLVTVDLSIPLKLP